MPKAAPYGMALVHYGGKVAKVCTPHSKKHFLFTANNEGESFIGRVFEFVNGDQLW